MTLVLAGAFGAPTALAESAVTLDCVHHNGRLTHTYTVAQLRNALDTMPAVIQEYNSECYQLILIQLNTELGHTKIKPPGTAGTTSSSGGFLSSPLLIALIVIVLAGGGFALASRRRRGVDVPPSGPEGDPDAREPGG